MSIESKNITDLIAAIKEAARSNDDSNTELDSALTYLLTQVVSELSPPVDTSNLFTLSGENYIIPKISIDPVANGVALLAAYTAAQTMEPGGNELSAKNRIVILLLPGIYDLGVKSFALTSDFIDVIGLSQNAKSVYITSSVRGAIDPDENSCTLLISAPTNDVVVKNIMLANTADNSADPGDFDGPETYAEALGYCFGEFAGSVSNLLVENIAFDSTVTASYPTAYYGQYAGTYRRISHTIYVNGDQSNLFALMGDGCRISGIFEDISVQTFSSAIAGIIRMFSIADDSQETGAEAISGTFTRCSAKTNKTGSLIQVFGYGLSATISTFTDCTISANSVTQISAFEATNSQNITAKRCSFVGATANWGSQQQTRSKFYNCELKSTDGAFFPSVAGTKNFEAYGCTIIAGGSATNCIIGVGTILVAHCRFNKAVPISGATNSVASPNNVSDTNIAL